LLTVEKNAAPLYRFHPCFAPFCRFALLHFCWMCEQNDAPKGSFGEVRAQPATSPAAAGVLELDRCCCLGGGGGGGRGGWRVPYFLFVGSVRYVSQCFRLKLLQVRYTLPYRFAARLEVYLAPELCRRCLQNHCA
jgi:hypothetical protein